MDDSPEIKVKIAFHPVEISFEAGSIDEAVAALTGMAPKLREARSLDLGSEGGPAVPSTPAAEPPPEGRKPRKPRAGKDPATAVAPSPLEVPADGSIPTFLKREAPPAPPLATAPVPPVPPLPNAPPVAPAPPPAPVAPPPPAPAPPNPTNALAVKVRAEVEKRGEAMLPWLVSAGVVVSHPSVTFDDACEVILYLTPDKLEPIAKALGVSA